MPEGFGFPFVFRRAISLAMLTEIFAKGCAAITSFSHPTDWLTSVLNCTDRKPHLGWKNYFENHISWYLFFITQILNLPKGVVCFLCNPNSKLHCTVECLAELKLELTANKNSSANRLFCPRYFNTQAQMTQWKLYCTDELTTVLCRVSLVCSQIIPCSYGGSVLKERIWSD